MKVLNKIKNWLYAIEITISVIIVVLIFFIAPSSNLWIRRKQAKEAKAKMDKNAKMANWL